MLYKLCGDALRANIQQRLRQLLCNGQFRYNLQQCHQLLRIVRRDALGPDHDQRLRQLLYGHKQYRHLFRCNILLCQPDDRTIPLGTNDNERLRYCL